MKILKLKDDNIYFVLTSKGGEVFVEATPYKREATAFREDVLWAAVETCRSMALDVTPDDPAVVRLYPAENNRVTALWEDGHEEVLPWDGYVQCEVMLNRRGVTVEWDC